MCVRVVYKRLANLTEPVVCLTRHYKKIKCGTMTTTNSYFVANNDDEQSLLGLLPIEIKWKILEYADYDTFIAVTGDHERADNILLSQGLFKKYFDTRPFDYCPNRDFRLAKYLKEDCVARLPLLADCLFQTYVKTQPENYVMTEDTLLKKFFNNEDITNLPLLIDGKFCEYTLKQEDSYDVTKDTLLMRYLGTGINMKNIVECYNRLIAFDKILRLVEASNSSTSKLLLMRKLRTVPFYAFFRLHKIAFPECLMPMNLAKVLMGYSNCLQHSSYILSKYCAQCYERSICLLSIKKFVTQNKWKDFYMVLFCSKCAYCLLNLPFEFVDFDGSLDEDDFLMDILDDMGSFDDY
ncbi:late expression factor 7 [Spodoptera frugiperda multiple nucleopolyhedrovirus]|uniref:LEF-7 n=1 Tax=Spodoptera frugiperda nuclear polyhedrosis virus TaxID=10455 RepID=A1YJ11_NPVSF|nr:late expression factor 7 [Spodoptera frugiperda multiple nucleopolyhedrovirus]ABM45732.1 late expression factor 7 [Spodoptera frugiperda multiple nucleopolyhedrovirus]QED39934.1 LEF-7 [Spodoptera frugiperda multiple nucleopolyhedrovirus]